VEPIIIRVSDPKTFKDKVAEARRLNKEGKKVIILADDIDSLLQVYDTEVLCDILNGIPFEETEQYNWGQLALKARQQWIEDEAKEAN
jgi:hypothetical protein